MTQSPPRIEDFRQRLSWREIEQSVDLYSPLLQCCAQEDLNTKPGQSVWLNDLTSSVCSLKGSGCAFLVAREAFVLCGINLPDLLLSVFACKEVNFEKFLEDGDPCQSGDLIGKIEGSVTQILAVERVILNFIQRLSGIATRSAAFVRQLEQDNVGLLDTRKTTPGLRIFEKFATGCGGSYNHRIGLFDRVLIKDNHLAAPGIKDPNSLIYFLKKVREKSHDNLIEVEIDDLSLLNAAVEGEVDAVLLDNFSPQQVAQAVQLNNNRVVLEASGGINLNNLCEYAQARPHFISTGAPVHAAKWVDIGMDWKN